MINTKTMQATAVDASLRRAAIEVLRERGFAGLTLERVAEVAGRARSTLWRQGLTREVLVQALVGDLAADFRETIHQVIYREPEAVRNINPSIPVDIEMVVSKCLEKRPERRYSTAAELQKDLMQGVMPSKAVIENHGAPSALAHPSAHVPQLMDSAAETQEQTSPSLMETLPDWMSRTRQTGSDNAARTGPGSWTGSWASARRASRRSRTEGSWVTIAAKIEEYFGSPEERRT